jgi:hypothetical protein
MTKIISLKCSVCGGSIDPEKLTCKYCGTSFVIFGRRLINKQKLKDEKIDEYKWWYAPPIRTCYYIGELQNWYSDWKKFLSECSGPGRISIEGKIVDLEEPHLREDYDVEYGQKTWYKLWYQLGKIRDSTGEIKVCFEGDIAGYIPMDAIVRIVNGLISLKYGEPTIIGRLNNTEREYVFVNPKDLGFDPFPHPNQEWVKSQLERVAKDQRYSRIALKILQVIVESEHPVKYSCYYEDLISKTGIPELEIKDVLDRLCEHANWDDMGYECWGHWGLIVEISGVILRKRSWLFSEIRKHCYVIPYNLRAYLPKILTYYL